jgi:segregation and condensation protein A
VSGMTQTISVNQFEGPLGLLLELVERNKMPVTDIAVAVITTQYLEHLAALDESKAHDLAEFLQLGSRLIYIKSLALLPNAPAGEEDDELKRLSTELAEYQRYQAAAKILALNAKHPTWSRRASVKLRTEDLPLPKVELTALAEAFQTALKRLDPPRARQIIASELSQADVIARLEQRLARGPFALDELLSSLTTRLEIIIMFSALLECIRSGVTKVGQASQFAPMMVERA